MNYKKWILIYMVFILITGTIVGLFNVVIDPYGVFGDRFLNWYAYNMTNNPRASKIAYLEKNHKNYDSYIVGSSKTGSFSTESLNKYFEDSSFYNMLMYGGDMYDIEKTVNYLVDNYEVKNLIVNIGLEEAAVYKTEKDDIKNSLHALVDETSLIKFYGKYFFANPEYSFNKFVEYFKKSYLPNQYSVFIPESGVYNKIIRDIEPVGAIDSFLSKNPGFNEDVGTIDMNHTNDAVESIKRIKENCEKKNINFELFISPVYYKEVQIYKKDKLIEYWHEIAKVTDFWDFSGYTPISFDARYFYDIYHFKNSVGNMALAFMFNDKSVYVPEGFGHYTTLENVSEHSKNIFDPSKTRLLYEEYTIKVPILMYHHLDEDITKSNSATVTPDKFRSDMKALKEKGYNAIFYQDLVDYVYKGNNLPQNPILITFDDGYTSNYEYAYPILKELGMKATISLIGVSVGKDTYKDTDKKIIPHFDYNLAKKMYESGIIDIQSHSYSMHDSLAHEKEYRDGVLKKETESEGEYISIFKNDYLISKDMIEKNVGNKVVMYTYPFGKHTVLTEALLREMGNKITVTTEAGVNTVIKGLPQSLYALNRINVSDDLSSTDLLRKIDEYIQ